jgi:hypothetical protein
MKDILLAFAIPSPAKEVIISSLATSIFWVLFFHSIVRFYSAEVAKLKAFLESIEGKVDSVEAKVTATKAAVTAAVVKSAAPAPASEPKA